MNYDEAKHQLRLHLGVLDEVRKELILDDGFVTGLRPYRGLHEKNFHLVMEALLTVGERLHGRPEVDSEVVQTVWSLCWYARIWGLRPEGMLRGNNLITPADVARLELWVDTIERTALHLLGGWPPHQAVYDYAEYVAAVGWWDNIDFFIALMRQGILSDTDYIVPTLTLRALGKLGGLAKGVLPALHEALKRTDSWKAAELGVDPAGLEGTKARHRAEIQEAIDAIERSSGDV